MSELSVQTRQALDSAMQLAVQRHQAGDVAAAEALYGKVLSVDAAHAGALHNLGLIRLGRGDAAGALLLLGAAVEQRPGEAVFQFNLGLARQGSGDIPGAAAAYRQAIACNANYRKAWENLGVVLQEQEQHAAAIEAYSRALQIDATSALARQNLGNALRALGRMEEAEAAYRAVLDTQPLHADAAQQLGATRLSRGDFSGWDWYEWRYWSGESLEGSKPYHVALPKWDGGELAGRELYLYGEQGIGDEIMFASCVADVAARAQQVHLWCEPRLAPLFARSFPGVRVEAKPRGGLPPLISQAAPSTVRCSLASLPRHLRRDESDFPATPYLIADASATARWRERLQALGGTLNIGLSWRGGGAPRAREARSIALARLAPLFDVPDIRVVNLQYGDHREEIAAFNASARHALVSFQDLDPLADMDDFAAAIAALDVVVCVDNSTAHLAGALGVPTLLLLPFQADWRWQRGRGRTPWYASLQLHWQAEPGTAAWSEVVLRASAALACWQKRPAVEQRQPAPAVGQQAATADVLLLNDTSYWYHWGCTCTSLALHEQLRDAGLTVDPVPITHVNALSPLPASVADFDDESLFRDFCVRNPALISRMQAVRMVMVNGEGSLHDLGQTARALLYLAYIAKRRFGLNTRIVNHSCYPATQGDASLAEAVYRKVYESLDFIAVRETVSLQRLEQLGIRATAAFDCLPLYVARHPPVATPRTGRRIVMSGCVERSAALVDMLVAVAGRVLQQGMQLEFLAGANAWLAHDDVVLLTALHARLRGRYTLVAASSESQWLGCIAGADLLVSGRFHHSIAAACLGTPLLLTGSNTPKNEGLLALLGLAPERVRISPAEPAQAIARLDALLREPGLGRTDAATLVALRDLAGRNFLDLPRRE